MDFNSLKISSGTTSATSMVNNSSASIDTSSSKVSSSETLKSNTNSTSKKNGGTSSSNNVSDIAKLGKSNDTSDAIKQLYKGDNYTEKLDKAISTINNNLKSMMVNKQFSYRVHKETNEVIIAVKDSKTGEVIKEIPSEESLDMIAKLRELAGIMVDEKR